MFTGIVKEVGRIDKVIKDNSLIKLGVKSTAIFKSAEASDSISVSGVCLTLIHKEKDLLFFEAIASTLKNTNIRRLKKGDYVNLEPALNLSDKLGGHFVLGHVDKELKLRRVITRLRKASLFFISVNWQTLDSGIKAFFKLKTRRIPAKSEELKI